VWRSTVGRRIEAPKLVLDVDRRRSDVPSASFSEDEIEGLCMRNLLANREERIFFKDRESRFLLVSQGWLDAEGHGRSMDDVIGRTDFEIFAEDHARAAFADEQRVIGTAEPIVAKLERETFDDRPDAWVSTTKLPLLDERGSIVGTWGIARDVSEQVRDDETIRRKAEGQAEVADLGRLALKGASLEELFDTAVGAAWRVLSSDCAWLVERETSQSQLIVRAEVGWLEPSCGEPLPDEEVQLFDHVARSAEAMVVSDWLKEERFSASSPRITRAIRSSVGVLVGDPASPKWLLEVQYDQPDAVPEDCVPFLEALANILSEAIRSHEAIQTIKRQSDSLATLTESLRALVSERDRLIEQIPGVVIVGAWYPDGSRTFEYVSRLSTTVLGIGPDEFVRDPDLFFEHLHPDDRELFRTAVRERASAGRDPLRIETRFIRPDDEIIWLRVEAAVVSADGPGHRVQALLFDITATKQAELERERLERELQLAQKLEAVGQLAAGVAHEINTPIQFIGDSVRFLKAAVDELLTINSVYHELLHTDEAIEGEERRQRIAQAEGEADFDYVTSRVPQAFERALYGVERVAAIVRAMRQFAHPATERSPTDVNDAIRTTLVVATNEYKYVADVDLDLGDLPLLTANAGDLNQVFLNLIVNAAHAIQSRIDGTDQRGTITIRTRAAEGDLIVTVSDTGCGIPAEIAGRVFDPFFTTKPVGRGTGQGLAIAHTIIAENHHGTISFEPNPGGGTTFRIAIPLDQSHELPRTLDRAA
jgi:PAS domain S-box-containing protein